MSDQGENGWIDRVSAALSAVVPLAFAIARLPLTSPWQGDWPLVRGLGLVGTAGSGGVTTLLVQLATLVPLGPRPFRAALVSAIALGASGLVVFALTRRLLLTNVATPRLAPLLATIAALTTTLSPSLQHEGTVPGGATVALLLSASALLVLVRGPLADARTWLLLGAATGATFVESAPLGLALVLALATHGLASRPSLRRDHLLRFAAAWLVTSAILLLPWLVRPLAPRAAYDLGRTLGTIDFVVADSLLSRTSALASWSREIGPMALLLAGLGVAIGLTRHRLRALVVPLVALALVDAALPLGTRGLLAGDSLAPLHAMAMPALAVLAAISVQTGATMTLATRTTAGGVAAVLLVMFDLTLAAMMTEAAGFSTDTRASRGASVWTDEAFSRLPSRTALLVRSRAMAWRLWSARLAEGARPDVLIVPAALLAHGRIAATLLEREPATAGLLRDLSMDGRPGEAALTALADTRPLEVELDPSWDDRLVSHLVADRLWLRFAPQPLGRSDRERAFEDARPRFEQVRAAATEGDALDPATAAILSAQLRAQAASAGVMGDREAALALLDRLTNVSPEDPFVAELLHRLAASKQGVKLDGLLR